MALDRWFPTRFATLSDRLVTQNGILLMGIAAVAIAAIGALPIVRAAARMPAGEYTVKEVIARLDNGKELTMTHLWPVKKARPFRQKLASAVPFAGEIVEQMAVRGAFVDVDAAAVEQALRVTAYGAFLVAQHAARGMLPKGQGAILFTGASAGVKGYPQSAPFAMGKFALRGLAQSMARELAPQGIHVAHVVIDGGSTDGSLDLLKTQTGGRPGGGGTPPLVLVPRTRVSYA